MSDFMKKFSLKGKVVVVTGGAGLLGSEIVNVVQETGGKPIIWDINLEKAVKNVESFQINISDKTQVLASVEKIGIIDVLVNNAAYNPQPNDSDSIFEDYSLENWQNELDVGLTGAMVCSQIVGAQMAKNGKGVIVNISSDLGLIAPDQRIYYGYKKPISYSVIKHGLIGLTKYLATYWAEQGVRVNAFCPGGIYNGQDKDFVEKLVRLIPLGRMANLEEYREALLFLMSDASSYMTGSNFVMDGGRTCW